VDSIHFYDSIIVIEKKKREKPSYAEKTGNVSFTTEYPESPTKRKLYLMKYNFIHAINLILRFLGIKYSLRIGGIFWKK
jgi:hypothetical protein